MFENCFMKANNNTNLVLSKNSLVFLLCFLKIFLKKLIFKNIKYKINKHTQAIPKLSHLYPKARGKCIYLKKYSHLFLWMIN